MNDAPWTDGTDGSDRPPGEPVDPSRPESEPSRGDAGSSADTGSSGDLGPTRGPGPTRGAGDPGPTRHGGELSGEIGDVGGNAEEAAATAAARRGPAVRRNALQAEAWVALTEVDPRVAEALLDSLEDAGVAAYAEPVAGVRGPWGDTRLPRSPTERIFVDARRRDAGEAIVAAELPGLLAELGGPVDEDAAFAAIVAGWDATPASPVPPWPADEDVEGAVRPQPEEPRRPYWTPAEPDDEDSYEPADDGEHFVPPPPEPLPAVHPVTRWAASALALGVFLLIGLPLFDTEPSNALSVLGALLVVGGVATLVLRMRDAPPVDDGPDDGAVV